jgi:hypothetical protein
MVIKGQMLRGSLTIDFSVHGERNHWTVSILAPTTVRAERETSEFRPYLLLDEMLNDAFNDASHRSIVGGAANR